MILLNSVTGDKKCVETVLCDLTTTIDPNKMYVEKLESKRNGRSMSREGNRNPIFFLGFCCPDE